ncbi:unnamed protein product, partial [Didymodactylos carnosus]
SIRLSSKTHQYLHDQLKKVTHTLQSLTLNSTSKVIRHIYSQSLNTFLIEKRNLTQLVTEMANYTNLAIMKKLTAIRNLVNVSEQTYRQFAKTTDEEKEEIYKYMDNHGYLSTKFVENKTLESIAAEANLTMSNSIISTSTSSSITQLDSGVGGGTATTGSTSTSTQESGTTGTANEPQEPGEYGVLKKPLILQLKKHFANQMVNVTHSTVHIPTIIYAKKILLNANWSYNLNQAFIDNYNQDPELTWQYFCSQTGLYRVWPGHKWDYPEGDTEMLDLFDCRVQNWYIRATSSPRDVVILIDASGSMTGLKKSIAIQTVETILDTLSDDDFVQILKFQEGVYFIDNCFQSGLVQATFENRAKFHESLNSNDMDTKGVANFSKALEKAFDILDEARTNISRTENVRLLCQCHYLTTDNYTGDDRTEFCPSDQNATSYSADEKPFLDSTGCNKMIMIVTDGATEKAMHVFQNRNWIPNQVSTCHPTETRVFTYMIGRELGDPKHIRWMSCANKGINKV